ncbi:hypothetical protein FKM82_013464, partial [Ascaphus truei]
FLFPAPPCLCFVCVQTPSASAPDPVLFLLSSVCNQTTYLPCGEINVTKPVTSVICLNQGCCFTAGVCYNKLLNDCTKSSVALSCSIKAPTEKACLAKKCCFQKPRCYKGTLNKTEEVWRIIYLAAAVCVFVLLIGLCVLCQIRQKRKKKEAAALKKKEDLSDYLMKLLEEPDEG